MGEEPSTPRHAHGSQQRFPHRPQSRRGPCTHTHLRARCACHSLRVLSLTALSWALCGGCARRKRRSRCRAARTCGQRALSLEAPATPGLRLAWCSGHRVLGRDSPRAMCHRQALWQEVRLPGARAQLVKEPSSYLWYLCGFGRSSKSGGPL